MLNDTKAAAGRKICGCFLCISHGFFCGRRVGYVVAVEADFRVLRLVGWHDTEGFASLHPRLRATRSARAFDLSGRAAVKQVMISLSEVVLLGMMTTPHRSLRSRYVVLTKNQPLGGRAVVCIIAM